MNLEHTTLETLESHLESNGSVALNDAINMALRILSILDYCHSRNMTHNNISPAKVIVDKGEPTLIDFSFPINGHKEAQVDNKEFIVLPEHQISLDIGRRDDTVSDVTCVAGLLLYVLTGQAPLNLKDDEGRMPHQRIDAREKIDKVAGFRSFLINQIFDRAFQWHQSDRYSSSVELIKDLEKLKNYKPSALPAKNLEQIVTSIRSESQSQTLTPLELKLQTAFNGVRKICSEVVHALEEDFRQMDAGFKKEITKPVYSAYLNFNYGLEEEQKLTLEFRIEIVGSELVVSGKSISENHESVEELYRVEHFTFTDSEEMEAPVLEFVASNLATFLSATIG